MKGIEQLRQRVKALQAARPISDPALDQMSDKDLAALLLTSMDVDEPGKDLTSLTNRQLAELLLKDRSIEGVCKP